MGIAALVLGICGIALCWIPWIGGICAVVGLILGLIAWVKSKKGIAIVGTILSAVGLIASVALFFYYASLVADIGQEWQQQWEEQMQQQQQ